MHRVLAPGIVAAKSEKCRWHPRTIVVPRTAQFAEKSAGIFKGRRTLSATQQAGRHAGNANWCLCYPMEGALASVGKGSDDPRYP